MSRFFICILFFLLFETFASAQKSKVKNLQGFDYRRIHFGFTLAYNSSNFRVVRKDYITYNDSVYAIEAMSQPGFNLGIVSALHISPYVSLRFLPELSFASRKLEYTFVSGNNRNLKMDKVVESTFLNFPLLVKYKSKRLNNFAAYVVSGGKFSIDLASKRKTEDDPRSTDALVKLEQNDYYFELGSGFDFYLVYFKFSLEFKMSYGLKNMLIQDNSIFTKPLDMLKSKIFILSFHFEG